MHPKIDPSRHPDLESAYIAVRQCIEDLRKFVRLVAPPFRDSDDITSDVRLDFLSMGMRSDEYLVETLIQELDPRDQAQFKKCYTKERLEALQIGIIQPSGERGQREESR